MSQTQTRTAGEIERWMIDTLGDLLDIPMAEINVTTHFDRYGLDSSSAISITEMLGNYLGHNLQPTLLYDYPNIQSLVQHLAGGAK
jgi:acyl carrier protein